MPGTAIHIRQFRRHNLSLCLRARSHLKTTTSIFVSSSVNSCIGDHETHFVLSSGMGAAPISDDRNKVDLCRCRQV